MGAGAGISLVLVFAISTPTTARGQRRRDSEGFCEISKKVARPARLRLGEIGTNFGALGWPANRSSRVIECERRLARPAGLEPATPGLEDRGSASMAPDALRGRSSAGTQPPAVKGAGTLRGPRSPTVRLITGARPTLSHTRARTGLPVASGRTMVGTARMDRDPELDVTLSNGRRVVTFQITALDPDLGTWTVVEPLMPRRVMLGEAEALATRRHVTSPGPCRSPQSPTPASPGGPLPRPGHIGARSTRCAPGLA